MKITKQALRRIIKEELDGAPDQDIQEMTERRLASIIDRIEDLEFELGDWYPRQAEALADIRWDLEAEFELLTRDDT